MESPYNGPSISAKRKVGEKTSYLLVPKNKAAASVASACIRARCHYVNQNGSVVWLTIGLLRNEPSKVQSLSRTKIGKLNRLPKEMRNLKRKIPALQTYLGGIKY
ncbi:hypothetical protein C4D60_Mb00t19300 [Musa balbisiana]|uniref:Uncharacterized protein n=1 Tax=Musa balbisiana TaxID=52838 RepID=A0A4S8I3V0_MUSBA|nr:hypothetical protein C4D60_Mb00t19300 [Musa balbisiana]